MIYYRYRDLRIPITKGEKVDKETVVFWCDTCNKVLLDPDAEHCEGTLEEIGLYREVTK